MARKPDHWPIRKAEAADIDPLAQLWFDGWMEAHEAHVPRELTEQRTLESLRTRIKAFADDLRTAGPAGAPLGFCAIKGQELDQLFVAPEGRGTDLAGRLLKDGEDRLAANGVRDAYLLCVIENARAARFYARMGWQNRGVVDGTVSVQDGGFTFRVLRFEKRLKI